MNPRRKNALLLIDPQIDFTQPTGSLYVPGAEKDCERTAKFIKKFVHLIDMIFFTLDSHHHLDISHGCFWVDKYGKPAPPHTVITAASIDAGIWSPRPDVDGKYARWYVHELERIAQDEISKGILFPVLSHYIWPYHCEIGTEGAAVDPILQDAFQYWEDQTGRNFTVHTKGTHPYTEHFGAFKAQVPYPNAPETNLNHDFIAMIELYDRVWSGGQARTHCFATTLKQLIYEAPNLAKKLIIMPDCMSDVVVPGVDFAGLCQPIYDEAKKIGIKFINSTDAQLEPTGQPAMV